MSRAPGSHPHPARGALGGGWAGKGQLRSATARPPPAPAEAVEGPRGCARAISTSERPTDPGGRQVWRVPGPAPTPTSPAAASAADGGEGSSVPEKGKGIGAPTYRAGAPAQRVREQAIGRTHFWEPWPPLLGAGERILRGGGEEGSRGGRAPRRSWAGRAERRGARPRGPASAAGGRGRARDYAGLFPRAAAPAHPAAEPAVRAPAATGSRAWPGAGSRGRHDAGDARL